MRMHDAKHGDMENGLFEGFCSAWVNSIVIDGCTAKEKVDKVVLKISIEFKCSSGWLSISSRDGT